MAHSPASTPTSSESSSTSTKRGTLQNAVQGKGVHFDSDNRICWDKDAEQHPRNWKFGTKTYTAALICWLEMYMTAISSSGTATADSAREEYGVSRTLAYFAFVTIYLLGQTIGGIFCSPISEVFGRRTIYILAATLFSVTSAIVAAVPSVVAVYFGRFFQGVAAAIPATVAFGNFDDMYNAEHRIWVVYLYTILGMLGLALGPIYSTYITATVGWRWVYYISTIVMGVTAVGCLFMRESNANQLLDKITKDIREETGIDDMKPGHAEGGKLTVAAFAQNALFRPLTFLVTDPLVLFCAILCAIAFGLIYGLTESLTIVYTAPPFNFSQTSSSLAFVAIAIGEVLNVLPRFYDAYVYKKYRKQHRRILPESKITSFAIAAPALAIGLWLFAWSIPPRVTSVPWPVSMIGLVIIGFSLNDFSYVLFGYATDSYGKYAASAVSAISLTRTLTAAVFPLFTHQMYTGLGSNVASSILAAVASLFAFTPFLFLRYGENLRHRSKFAVDNEEALKLENAHMKDDD
ncbi:major facilitator superfamily protein [Sarocladium implicatum]|nr:major facilitator superfamily protein [Sarocladium implicatum]